MSYSSDQSRLIDVCVSVHLFPVFFFVCFLSPGNSTAPSKKERSGVLIGLFQENLIARDVFFFIITCYT